MLNKYTLYFKRIVLYISDENGSSQNSAQVWESIAYRTIDWGQILKK